MRHRRMPRRSIARSGRGSRIGKRGRSEFCTAGASPQKTLPSCWRSGSWTAYWWAARPSIRAVGSSLCAPRRRRYLAPRMYTIFVIILILDSFILATAVLLQAGQGGGLATMGGGAGTETVMGGRQATTLLTKLTWWTAGIFLFLALLLTFMSSGGTQVRSGLPGQQGAGQQAPAPVQQTPLPIETQPTPTPPPAPPAAKPPTNRRP